MVDPLANGFLIDGHWTPAILSLYILEHFQFSRLKLYEDHSSRNQQNKMCLLQPEEDG
jgi:hypothetical protein